MYEVFQQYLDDKISLAAAEADRIRDCAVLKKVRKRQYLLQEQTIADGILHLVEMKKGTRPLRFPLDAIAQGTDQEFIEARAAIKSKWLAAYNG